MCVYMGSDRRTLSQTVHKEDSEQQQEKLDGKGLNEWK